MNWKDWQPFYQDIAEKLGLEIEQDRVATDILSELLKYTDHISLITKLERMIRNRTVVVCGTGPSLIEHLEIIKSDREHDNSVFIAADGAASAFLELDLTCNIIVTDLDGRREDFLIMAQRDVLSIVHAHGDNINALRDVVPNLSQVIGSTQVEPKSNVFLWGGFTDGDRACYLATHYSPKRLVLAGMDFGDVVGRWSKPGHSENFPASKRKIAKLSIAKTLLSNLWATTNTEYHFLGKKDL
ncbi:MAG: 6-hydroxymethylpterin diphosphokinase MptE-like protein [Candidatus Thorarchaeota archaeon]